jgi:hypothetical protein
VSFIRFWYTNRFGQDSFQSGCNSLANVFEQFVKPSSEPSVIRPETPESSKKEAGSSQFKIYYAAANKREQEQALIEATNVQRKRTLDKEILKFKNILFSHNFNYKHTTNYFWATNNQELHNLSRLANVLLNIPASSAFIERFFSIAGVVFSSRRGNSYDDLIISRSLLKTNMETIESLTIEGDFENFESSETDK